VRSANTKGGSAAAVPRIAACLLLLAAPAARAEQPVAGERFDTVVLDAGHGGDDHGAEGPAGLREKDLVLDVARRLRTRLEHDGLHVLLTRDSDVYVPLAERTAIANRSSADLFVSVHANAATARSARGIETFFVALEASDDAARKLAERENAAFREKVETSSDDALASILGDLAANDQMRESDEFARLAHQELVALTPDVPSRGVKQAPFVVLLGVQMPAALVEIGFITNPEDERAMTTGERRDQIADALERAVRAFAERYDARRGVQRDRAAPARTGGGA
jgi:N-acetylmuramoyl-L-alanine amidase